LFRATAVVRPRGSRNWEETGAISLNNRNVGVCR